MNAPRVFYCLFCDDIRREVGGKTSLIGIYHGDIKFNSPKPVVYPKLCGYLIVICEPDDAPEFVEVTMHVVEEEEIVRFKVDTDQTPKAREGAEKLVLNIAFQTPLISFTKEGWLEVWAETEREKVRAGRLLVSFKESEASDEKEDS